MFCKQILFSCFLYSMKVLDKYKKKTQNNKELEHFPIEYKKCKGRFI